MFTKSEKNKIENYHGLRCKYCSSLANDPHHIWFQSEKIVPKELINSPFNVIPLCRTDHNAIHSYTLRGKELNIKAKIWSMNNYNWDKSVKEKMKLKLTRLKL